MPARSKSAPKAKGPFFLYMLEFRRREESKGKSFPGGMDQVLHEAGTSWKLLSETERQVYKDQSLAYRSQQKQNTIEKVDSEQRNRTKKQQTIDKAISEMIQEGMRKNMLEKLEVKDFSFIIILFVYCTACTFPDVLHFGQSFL